MHLHGRTSISLILAPNCRAIEARRELTKLWTFRFILKNGSFLLSVYKHGTRHGGRIVAQMHWSLPVNDAGTPRWYCRRSIESVLIRDLDRLEIHTTQTTNQWHSNSGHQSQFCFVSLFWSVVLQFSDSDFFSIWTALELQPAVCVRTTAVEITAAWSIPFSSWCSRLYLWRWSSLLTFVTICVFFLIAKFAQKEMLATALQPDLLTLRRIPEKKQIITLNFVCREEAASN